MLTFTIGLLFFTSNNTAVSEVPNTDSAMHESSKEIEGVIVDKMALDPSWNNISTEDKVRDYFEETPILAEIAWCESKFKHYTKNGKVLRGEVTPKDVGVMQINEYYHGKTADVLGINLHTLEGNMEYAEWLYEREGTRPWNSSKYCWGKHQKVATNK